MLELLTLDILVRAFCGADVAAENARLLKKEELVNFLSMRTNVGSLSEEAEQRWT